MNPRPVLRALSFTVAIALVPKLPAQTPTPAPALPPSSATLTTRDPHSAARARMTRSTPGSTRPITTGTPGLMMPAFSAAISSTVSPSISQ